MRAPILNLILSIQGPDLGRCISSEENVAKHKKGKPSPRENEPMSAKPRPKFCSRAISVRIKPKTGPVQGAATTPATRPMINAPRKPFPPMELSLFKSRVGITIVTMPNMASAKRKNITAMLKRTSAFCMSPPVISPK
ncbi:MAG: hypothetical protein BWZ03_00597 [bacterium ADurb.BinA186]|nr:MAG: hypothetical protein BWZ03_00597 [bacterium ADurb.BinA186]